MAKDPRIFRVTKQGYRRTTTQYKSRTAISAMFARNTYACGNNKRPDILKVEAIDPADIEWADVTDEFRNKPDPKCSWHPAYTGIRKPHMWGWKDQEYVQKYGDHCNCTAVYLGKHPEYPRHDPLCSLKHTDPEQCTCKILKKILE